MKPQKIIGAVAAGLLATAAARPTFRTSSSQSQGTTLESRAVLTSGTGASSGSKNPNEATIGLSAGFGTLGLILAGLGGYGVYECIKKDKKNETQDTELVSVQNPQLQDRPPSYQESTQATEAGSSSYETPRALLTVPPTAHIKS